MMFPDAEMQLSSCTAFGEKVKRIITLPLRVMGMAEECSVTEGRHSVH